VFQAVFAGHSQGIIVSVATAPSFLGRHQFLIRRLHSLSGLIPVGAYMCIHLLTNASVLDGTRTFQRAVDQIHLLGSALPLVEWTFIFLPLIFHAVVGVVIVRSGEFNSSHYPYTNNVRYVLQRVTAWIALFFIFYHVFQMHGWIKPIAEPLGGAQFDPHHATSTAATALQPIVIRIAYVIGILACVYHLANGIWTMGITWGVWTSPAAQRRANYGVLVFGILLAAVGLGALKGMTGVNVEEARQVEERLEAARQLANGEITLGQANEVAGEPAADPNSPTTEASN
jgi:succinate dehydrogenase / fumarate reductase cytochrome b subunit